MKKIIEQQYIHLLNLELLTKKGDKFNFRCPYCGDSKKTPRKKRGFLLWNRKADSYIFHCFNCDKNTNFYKFLEFTKPELLPEYIKECNEEKLENFGESKALKPYRDNIISTIKLPSDLVPCSDNKDCLNYVLKREVPSSIFSKWFYDKKNDAVLIPFYKGNEIYGYQSRKLKQKFFHNELPEDNIKIWNWYNVRISEPIIYVESIFDASIMYNMDYQGVALVGKSIPKKIEYKIYNSGDKAIFIFDNDSAGNIQAEKYSQMFPEARFILWDKKLKNIKDIGELYTKVQARTKKFIQNNISGSEYLLKSKLRKI